MPKQIYKPPKVKVGENGIQNIDQKIFFQKKLFLSLVHEGFNISSACDKLNISRDTIYRYMAEDEEFEQGVRASSIADNQLIGIVGVIDNMKKGDLGAQKYYLDKTRYFEKRQDIGDQNNLLVENEQGVFEVPSDIKRIADSLIDEIPEGINLGKEEDILKQALAIKDRDTADRLDKVRERFNDEA